MTWRNPIPASSMGLYLFGFDPTHGVGQKLRADIIVCFLVERDPQVERPQDPGHEFLHLGKTTSTLPLREQKQNVAEYGVCVSRRSLAPDNGLCAPFFG